MRYLYVILFCFPLVLSSQVTPVTPDASDLQYLIIERDSLGNPIIDLDEVVVLPKLSIKDKKERIKYLILRRKTLKVYPYAKLASERLVELQKRLEELPRKRQKKKYARIIQKYIEDEFSVELKKLTRTEGQILVKLIHRQTGKTTFQLIKELRSGWRAFWFNNTASLFDISLKREYMPNAVQEDFLIEDILLRAFQNGRLEKQEPAFEIDYYDIYNKWSSNSKLLSQK